MNLWLIFLTGLTTGGFTCLALQGGLLATAIAAQKGTQDQTLKSTFLPTLIFIAAKISAYALVGFLLGLFGSVFQLSIQAQIVVQFLVGAFMIITALRMLDVHPIFRRFVLTPPKVVFKFMRTNAKSGSFFSPLVLGLATVFLPCGTTQAMEIQALGSGNAFLGAATLFAFTLGTAPLFFVLGSLATKFSQTLEKYVYPIAAGLVLMLGIMGIDNGLTLAGSSFTLKELWRTATSPTTNSQVMGVAQVQGEKQTATITAYATGYEPQRMSIKAGIPTTLTVVTNNTQGCVRGLTFPTLKIQKILPATGDTQIQIPALSKGTEIPFSCSMGMFSGKILVV